MKHSEKVLGRSNLRRQIERQIPRKIRIEVCLSSTFCAQCDAVSRASRGQGRGTLKIRFHEPTLDDLVSQRPMAEVRSSPQGF